MGDSAGVLLIGLVNGMKTKICIYFFNIIRNEFYKFI